MPMGGFSGSVPQPTLAEVRHLVSTGQLRYFLLGGGRGGGGTVSAINTWVQSTCTQVTDVEETLYRCASG